MCSRKSHVVNVQHFLHKDNSQWCLLYRYMDGVLHWACLSDDDNWLKVAPHIMISPAFTYSFDFWMLTKCPMFANEQWNKAQWDLLGSPIVMLIISLTFLMMAEICFMNRHCQPNLTGIWDTTELFPVPGLTFHALGGAKMHTTTGTQNYLTPKIDMGRIKY